MKLFVLGVFFVTCVTCAGCYPYFTDYHAPTLRQECPSLSIRCYKDDLYQELYHVVPILKVNKEFVEIKDQNKIVFAIGFDEEKMEEEKNKAKKELGEGVRFLPLIPEEAYLELPERYQEGTDVNIVHFDQTFDFQDDPVIERFRMEEGFLVTLTFGAEEARNLFIRKVMSGNGLLASLSFKFYASEIQGQWKLIVPEDVIQKLTCPLWRRNLFDEGKWIIRECKVEQFDPSFIDRETLYLYSVRAFFHYFYSLYGAGGRILGGNYYEKKISSHESTCLFDGKRKDIPFSLTFFNTKGVEEKRGVANSIEEKVNVFFKSNFMEGGFEEIDGKDYYACDACFRRAWRKYYPEIGPTVQMTHPHKPAPDSFLWNGCYRSHRLFHRKPGPVTLDVYATYPITSKVTIPVFLRSQTQ